MPFAVPGVAKEPFGTRRDALGRVTLVLIGSVPRHADSDIESSTIKRIGYACAREEASAKTHSRSVDTRSVPRASELVLTR